VSDIEVARSRRPTQGNPQARGIVGGERLRSASRKIRICTCGEDRTALRRGRHVIPPAARLEDSPRVGGERGLGGQVLAQCAQPVALAEAIGAFELPEVEEDLRRRDGGRLDRRRRGTRALARPGGRKRQHERKLSGDFEKRTQELHSATE
jgi:hypothetical protein